MENTLPQQPITHPINQPIAPPPVTTTPKTFPKKIIILITAVIILILISAGTYLLVNNQANVNPKVSTTITPTSSPTPTIIPTNVIWEIKEGIISTSDAELIQNQILQKTKTVFPNTDIVITSASVSGNLGVLVGIEQLKTPGPVQPTTTYTFLINKDLSG